MWINTMLEIVLTHCMARLQRCSSSAVASRAECSGTDGPTLCSADGLCGPTVTKAHPAEQRLRGTERHTNRALRTPRWAELPHSHPAPPPGVSFSQQCRVKRRLLFLGYVVVLFPLYRYEYVNWTWPCHRDSLGFLWLSSNEAPVLCLKPNPLLTKHQH